MRDQMPCEQFGAARAREIHDLIEAATGDPCPGRLEGRCPLALVAEIARPDLRVVAS